MGPKEPNQTEDNNNPSGPPQPPQPSVPQDTAQSVPTAPSVSSPGPIESLALPPLDVSSGGKAKKILALAGAAFTLLVASAVLIYYFGTSGTDLGALKNTDFAQNEDHGYSMDVFEQAELESSTVPYVPTTLRADMASTLSDDELTSVSMVLIEDIEAIIQTANQQLATQLTTDDIIDRYLSGQATTNLENIIESNVSLDNVQINEDFASWTTAHISRGIQADFEAESDSGVRLVGRVLFGFSNNKNYGYTLILVAQRNTWDKNQAAFTQIIESLDPKN